jgi:hypothetical protein
VIPSASLSGTLGSAMNKPYSAQRLGAILEAIFSRSVLLIYFIYHFNKNKHLLLSIEVSKVKATS